MADSGDALTDIDGVILAGGLARRMHQQDKGLVVYHGRPLIAWVSEILRSQVTKLFINANRNLDDYAPFGDQVVCDCYPGFKGPLVGMYSAMLASDAPWLLTAPCDAPLLPKNYAAEMRAKSVEAQVPIVVAYANDRAQPTHMLLATELAASLDTYLRAGKGKIDGWYALHRHAFMNFSTPEAFVNINTPADLTINPLG